MLKKIFHKFTAASLNKKFIRFPWRVVGLATGALALMIISALAWPPKANQAAPYLGCSPHGYIFKYQGTTTTNIQAIDMVTGQGSPAGLINNAQFNAVGYNPKDNYFYGWDLNNSQFARVNSSGLSPAPIEHFSTVAGFPAGQPISSFYSGDVDEDGFHWTFSIGAGNSFTWYKIDLNTASPTYVAHSTALPPTGTEGTDWAYVPGTNKLYRAMDKDPAPPSGNGIEIWAFDRGSLSWTPVGDVSNITVPADGDMGAVYADPSKNFYMSSHDSGKLFRVNLNDTPPFTAVELEAADSENNDGARCSLASVPIDSGDAPSPYNTLIADDGPRHSIAGFNIFNSTAPLMLGQNIDLDVDGFPGALADGDDNDHQGVTGGVYVDDERGVQHIVAIPGSTTPLIVPVKVANTSGQAAILAGWIDLDNDSQFEAGERVTANIPDGFSGFQQLTFPAPPAPYGANTYARFRIFSFTDTSNAAVNLLPGGPANGGEVEDVLVQVGSFAVSKIADPPEGSTVDPGETVTYTLTIQNTGSTPLANLNIDDDLTDVLDDATLQSGPIVNPPASGSAAVNGNMLEFVGNIGPGDSAAVTYSVKIKGAGLLGNLALNNFVLAAHSAACHPQLSGSSPLPGSPDCQTTHQVNGLADTGHNVTVFAILAAGLLALGVVLRRVVKRPE